MSYTTRVYRQRNAHVNDDSRDQAPFFNKSEKQHEGKKGGSPFFQAKLDVGKPGDPYEKEADAVASAVVNEKSAGPVAQRKMISSVQKLATPQDEEGMSTNEERMKEDKDVQQKPDIQAKCAECEKEEKGEKAVNKKDDPQKEKEKEKLKSGGTVQKKADHAKGSRGNISGRLEQNAGRGRSLPGKTLDQMQSSFRRDFRDVNIHTGADAAEMSKELGAQAFTHGKDIYFNEGKYQPETNAGKELLAHELTHVVQQNADGKQSA